MEEDKETRRKWEEWVSSSKAPLESSKVTHPKHSGIMSHCSAMRLKE